VSSHLVEALVVTVRVRTSDGFKGGAVASDVAAAAAGACRAGGFMLRYLEAGGSGFVERRGALAACWNTRFEEVPPVRRFPSYKGQRNFPGLYFAACMGRHVGFESWLERPVDRTNREQGSWVVRPGSCGR
jgi:hypothetical protein